jgi:hypothetical protein
MTDKVVSIVRNAGSAADWLTELAEELRPESDPTTKLCVVIVTYDGDGMMRLRSHKHNANVLEIIGMLELSKNDYSNAG